MELRQKCHRQVKAERGRDPDTSTYHQGGQYFTSKPVKPVNLDLPHVLVKKLVTGN